MAKPIMSARKFINQWLRYFARNIDDADRERCYVNNYIWHIFSYELLDEGAFLVGDDARTAYDAMDKTDCIFYDVYGKRGISDKMLPEYSSAKQIDENLVEFYVVARDYSWTYIKTHENDLCGPYFMKRK